MKPLLYLIVILFALSCSTEPKPIAYGQDACDFCEMTIVDQSFSAQAVSEKGKQFKYDAIECMVNDLHTHSTKMVVQQVADYSNPGIMIPVEQAIFTINDSIKSPMGANLAAISKDSRLASPQRPGDLNWHELLEYLKEKDSVFTEDE